MAVVTAHPIPREDNTTIYDALLTRSSVPWKPDLAQKPTQKTELHAAQNLAKTPSMADYDFTQVNDKEFEVLVTDLLSRELGTRVERFKIGKDLGVDGRYFAANSETIIQCKHWIKSGLDVLMRRLGAEEKLKVQRLKPHRYLLITSLPLSRKNKKQIKDILAPWIKSESDVMGQEDLNDLLRRHPAVEQSHYKLWFQSVVVLQQLLNASIVGRSQFQLDEAREFRNRYVVTTSHSKAVTKLEKINALIITGEPGVGKSTLAEQLVLEYVARGYQLCCVGNSIEDGEALWRKNTKQMFYFDDFLGRNFLLALSRNEDSHIVNFIKRVSKDHTKRMILTSRTTVLNQGKAITDMFRIANLEQREFELRIDALSLLEKGRILYSHLWHSDLSSNHIDQLYENKRYATIAKHRSFNPRLIAFITDAYKLRDIPGDKYWAYVESTLNNPIDIWEHVFNSQLTPNARLIVRLVVINGTPISEESLLNAFRNYLGRRIAEPDSADEFRRELQLAVGSVLNRILLNEASSASISLFNPSLGDYVMRLYCGDSEELKKCLIAIRSESGLKNLEAMARANIITNSQASAILREVGEEILPDSKFELQLRLRIAELLLEESDGTQGLQAFLSQILTVSSEEYPDVQAWLLYTSAARNLIDDEGEEYHQKLLSLVEAATTEEEIRALLAPADRIPLENKESIVNMITEKYVEWLKENIDSKVSDDDVVERFRDSENLTAAAGEVLKYIGKQASSEGFELSEAQVRYIAGGVDLNSAMAPYYSSRSMVNDGLTARAETEAADLDDLFDRG